MTDNIFDKSGNWSHSKKNTDSHESGKGIVKKIKTNLLGVENESELKNILDKIRFMKEDLENQLSEVYRKGKEAKINTNLLLENKFQFSTKELEKLQEEEKKLRDKIDAVILPESCLQKKGKNKETMTKERKGKTRGARNNWIPIR